MFFLPKVYHDNNFTIVTPSHNILKKSCIFFFAPLELFFPEENKFWESCSLAFPRKLSYPRCTTSWFQILNREYFFSVCEQQLLGNTFTLPPSDLFPITLSCFRTFGPPTTTTTNTSLTKINIHRPDICHPRHPAYKRLDFVQPFLRGISQQNSENRTNSRFSSLLLSRVFHDELCCSRFLEYFPMLIC